MLGLFVQWPWLALLPAVAFAIALRRCRRTVVRVAATAWLAYVPYEMGMKLRIFCSGECNIRIDLLLIYPALAILSAWAVRTCLKTPSPGKDS